MKEKEDTSTTSTEDTSTTSTEETTPTEDPEERKKMKEQYRKIWENAHIASYRKWASMLGTSIDITSNRALITKSMCQKYEYDHKGGKYIGKKDAPPFLEWHDEVGNNGACINYNESFIGMCDSLAESFDEQKDYFKYVPPTFECNDKDKCKFKDPPACNVPEAYCVKQLAKYRENETTCAGECYLDEGKGAEACSWIVGDVMCRMLGNNTGFTIGSMLRDCNMSTPGFGQQTQCSPPPGVTIPNTLGKIIDTTNTSIGYLRPKNLWDIKYAGQVTINPKCQIFSDTQLRVMIQRQPWFIVSHDSDYKTPMAYFGHYYKVPGFKFYDYIDFIIQFNITPKSDDNTLHIYTIDLVNFGDWASEISKCKPLETLKRMLTQVMITNFSMRSFNTLAVNGEKWADKTKVFNIPFEMKIRQGSVPTKKPFSFYGSDRSGLAPFEEYSRDSRFKAGYLTNTFATDIVLMKWPNGFKIGDVDLKELLNNNLSSLETTLFNIGEYISATSCPTDWNNYKTLTSAQKAATVSWMCYYQEAKVVGGVSYPEVGTTITSKLLIQGNSLICRVEAKGKLLSGSAPTSQTSNEYTRTAEVNGQNITIKSQYQKLDNLEFVGENISCRRGVSEIIGDDCKSVCDGDSKCKGYVEVLQGGQWGQERGCCFKKTLSNNSSSSFSSPTQKNPSDKTTSYYRVPM